MQERPGWSLDWPQRERLMDILTDLGVLWVQLTGGEPLLDPMFPQTYAALYERGMSLRISTNGALLSKPEIVSALAIRPPLEITVSLYGASDATVRAVTGQATALRRTIAGIQAAKEANLTVRARIIVTTTNAAEENETRTLADGLGIDHHVYRRLSPGMHGSPGPLTLQQPGTEARKPFTGCSAGTQSIHIDPHGHAYVCPVARKRGVDLLSQGTAGLPDLHQIAADLLSTPATAGTCPPLAALYVAAGIEGRRSVPPTNDGGRSP